MNKPDIRYTLWLKKSKRTDRVIYRENSVGNAQRFGDLYEDLTEQFKLIMEREFDKQGEGPLHGILEIKLQR